MKHLSLYLIIIALASGCTSVSTRSDAPAIPDAPINEHTSVGACDNNIVAEYPGHRGRGSSTLRCTKSITDIKDLIGSLNPKSTLLVMDIDDTLLTSDTFFGSDSWYEWLKSDQAPSAAKPSCKFDIIALNYESGTQHAVEGAASVAYINGVNLPKLLLTSRNPYYRAGTERELLAAGYEFPANFLAGSDGISWNDIDPVSRQSAPISYANGIQMTTGRKKGKMLLELLRRLKSLKHGQNFKNIILVDDGPQNINSLHAELPKAGYNYYGYWYRRVDKLAPKAGTPAADEATKALNDWRELIDAHYPNRGARWQLPNGEGCGV